ncbi:MAG TPA: LON peptidase substrate-binding domain-containing protein [Fibrobacteria bacterium]|nr:LON peptidase substrate-binding domain-containing protein [Fibrobacteria bacterium]
MHPGKFPVFPLKTLCFPGHRLPLRVFEERYLQMLKDIAETRTFVISLLSHGEEVGGEATPFRVGTLVDFEDIQVQGDYHLLRPRGRTRVYLESFDRESRPYLTALAVPYEDESATAVADDRIPELESGILAMASRLGPEESRDIPEVLGAMRAELGRENYSLFLCGCLELPPIYLQRLLESRSLAYRIDNALNLLAQRK